MKVKPKRIKLISVQIKKLFGIFDHVIKFNCDSGITIMIGENGLGKTVLLEMIEAFFNKNFSYFNKIEFEEMIFEFDDKVSWKLYKEQENNRDLPSLQLMETNKKQKSKPIYLNNFDQREIARFMRRMEQNYPIRQIGARKWRDMKTGEIYGIDDLFYKFNFNFDRNLFNEYAHGSDKNLFNASEEVVSQPEWFIEKYARINVKLIETQRLISLSESEEKAHTKNVEKYSTALSKEIKTKLTESTELSAKLDRTYPSRLIKKIKNSTNTNVTDKFINDELKRLEDKRKLLDAVGLIEIDKDSNISYIENSSNELKNVLVLYAEDSFQKIQIFDHLSQKIEMFLSIINKRFKHKKLFIDKDKGFVFKSTTNLVKEIHLDKLSSGEQNELVLFYLLLFKTEQNSLILIDEPEVSLHISWQHTFIEDLKEIAKINNLEVLIATHSPDIIANNWALKVELKGVE
ncbi:MAG: AAA family ATPase [Sulfuricurvum sp.]|nr:AAA family ATPase [Sulfuricurvum sp.]